MKKTIKHTVCRKLAALIIASLMLVIALAACTQAQADTQTPANDTPVSNNNDSNDNNAVPEAPAVSDFDTSKNVTIVAREDGSGTKSAFMEIIGLKGKADPAGVIIQNGTAGILAEVMGNPNAIAYESLGYVTSEVKMLTIDGVEATIANIQSGAYKISRPLSIVYKESTLDDAANLAFYTFLQSADAQEIIASNGYVSLADDAEPYVINGDLSGTIDVSGSTSLQPLMVELEAAFKALQPNITVNVSGGGSGTGYNNAEEGVSEFGMISEEFSSEKAPSCVYYIVAKDGIAVIVNGSNPLEDISMDMLNTLYDEESETIYKWSDIIG